MAGVGWVTAAAMRCVPSSTTRLRPWQCSASAGEGSCDQRHPTPHSSPSTHHTAHTATEAAAAARADARTDTNLRLPTNIQQQRSQPLDARQQRTGRNGNGLAECQWTEWPVTAEGQTSAARLMDDERRRGRRCGAGEVEGGGGREGSSWSSRRRSEGQRRLMMEEWGVAVRLGSVMGWAASLEAAMASVVRSRWPPMRH